MQFGKAFQRVLHSIIKADPRFGPVHMSKIDIADGFYRVWLQTADIIKLGVALPVPPGHPPLVAFPLALPMGWVESPPYFTALTETICDLTNAKLGDPRYTGTPHRLETAAATPAPDTTVSKRPRSVSAPIVPRRPVARVDVYVDDFLLLAQTQHQQLSSGRPCIRLMRYSALSQPTIRHIGKSLLQ